jgi:hypothetical protein
MDPDPDTALFVIDLQDPKKTNLKKKFSCLLLVERTVHLHHFKDKTPKEVTKQWQSRFFLLFLLDDRRIRMAQKHVEPDQDSDPEHCLEGCTVSGNLQKLYYIVSVLNSRVVSAFPFNFSVTRPVRILNKFPTIISIVHRLKLLKGQFIPLLRKHLRKN